MRRLALLALAVLAAACASTDPQPAPFLAAPAKNAWIVAADGRPIGEARFLNAPGGVLIQLEFSASAMPPGWPGAHLHERGDCSDFAAGFQAAGGHIGRGEHVRHGLRSEWGPEAGDLPNLYAATTAPYGAEFLAPGVTLDAPTPDRLALLDADGSALIIHAAPDDQQSQPIGAAGPRIACAALTLAP